MDFEVSKNEFLRQFETKIDGKLIKLEFSEQEKNIFLTRFEIHNSLEEGTYKDDFIKAVLDNLAEEDKKVIPSCPAVTAYFRKNRALYKHLLPAGINL